MRVRVDGSSGGLLCRVPNQELSWNGHVKGGATLKVFGREHAIRLWMTPAELCVPVVAPKLTGLAQELWENKDFYTNEQTWGGAWRAFWGKAPDVAVLLARRKDALARVELVLEDMLLCENVDRQSLWTLYCVSQAVLEIDFDLETQVRVRTACYEWMHPRLRDGSCLKDLLDPAWKGEGRVRELLSKHVNICRIFSPLGCRLLLEEALNFAMWVPDSKLDVRGVYVTSVPGFRTFFDAIVKDCVVPLCRDMHPCLALDGCRLVDAYFIHYEGTGEYVDHAPHTDKSDLTLNTCLDLQGEGGDLVIIGDLDDREIVAAPIHPPHPLEIRQTPHMTIVHAGKLRHSAKAMVAAGRRTNLVIWVDLSFVFEQFLLLPKDVIHVVLDYLTPWDHASLAQTCRFCASIILGRDPWFESYCERRCPGITLDLKSPNSKVRALCNMPSGRMIQFAVRLQKDRFGSLQRQLQGLPSIADMFRGDFMDMIRSVDSELCTRMALLDRTTEFKLEHVPHLHSSLRRKGPISRQQSIMYEERPDEVALRCCVQ